MGRGGVAPSRTCVEVVAAVDAAPATEIVGIWTHLADGTDPDRSAAQIARYEAALDAIAATGRALPLRHVGATRRRLRRHRTGVRHGPGRARVLRHARRRDPRLRVDGGARRGAASGDDGRRTTGPARDRWLRARPSATARVDGRARVAHRDAPDRLRRRLDPDVVARDRGARARPSGPARRVACRWTRSAPTSRMCRRRRWTTRCSCSGAQGDERITVDELARVARHGLERGVLRVRAAARATRRRSARDPRRRAATGLRS